MAVVINTPTPAAQGEPAAVVEGFIAPDASDAKFLYRNEEGVWEDYVVISHFMRSENVYMMGLTSPRSFQGDSVAFCQLASPTLLWVCDWTAARWGKQPVIPSTVSQNANWIFMYKANELRDVKPAADGKIALYRISGTYVYGHRNPNADPDSVNEISFPRPPWLIDTLTAGRRVPPNSLQKNIIDAATGGKLR